MMQHNATLKYAIPVMQNCTSIVLRLWPNCCQMADLNVQDFGKIYVLELDGVMEIMFCITIHNNFVFLVNLPLHFQCGKRT